MPTPGSARTDIPRPARVLGLGGLLPFLSGALMVWCPLERVSEFGILLLGTYGAVILSFLGGVRWGRLLAEPSRETKRRERWLPFVLSILPSLVAWAALLLPPAAMFALLAIGLVLQYLIDRDATESGELPPWYGRLRLILSAGAVPAVLSGLLAALLLV